MGSSLAVPEEQGLGLFKGVAPPQGLPAVDRLTNKSGSVWYCCTTAYTRIHVPVYAEVVNTFRVHSKMVFKSIKECFVPFQLSCSGACWTLCQLRTKKEMWCSFWLHLRTLPTRKPKPSTKTRRKVSMRGCVIKFEWILVDRKEKETPTSGPISGRRAGKY